MNRIKRAVALLLALALALLAGCSDGQRTESSSAAGEQDFSQNGEPAQDAPAKSLLEHGQELVSLMGEMAGNEAYIDLYTGSPEIGELLAEAGKGDHSAPAAVYRIRFPESALGKLLELSGLLDSLDGLSDELRESVRAKAIASLPTRLNGLGGANVLAAASVCTAGKTFRSTEVSGNGLIDLYLYENAVPAAVVFLPGEDGTVSASGMLILYDGFQSENPDDLSGMLEELGAEVFKIF